MYLILCTEQIEAEHTGYRTYYGGGRYGIRKVDVPVFILIRALVFKVNWHKMCHIKTDGKYGTWQYPSDLHQFQASTNLYFSEKSKTGYDSVLVYGAFFIVLGAVMRMR